MGLDVDQMLSEVDREILVCLLIKGDNTPRNIAEICNRHHQSIQDRLEELSDKSLIRNKGRGVYRLTEKGIRYAQTVAQEYQVLDDVDNMS